MTLRGVFLTSDQPARTARFYSEVAALALDEVGEAGGYVYWKLDDGRMQLAIHDAKAFADYAFPPLAASNLTHLYFQIQDQGQFLERLRALDITPHAVDEVVVTIVDPDGRKVLFGTA
jgi:hypothetical protein